MKTIPIIHDDLFEDKYKNVWANIDKAIEIFSTYHFYSDDQKDVRDLFVRELFVLETYLLGDLNNISDKYLIRRINLNDNEEVLNLMKTNHYYFKCCPPFPNEDTLKEDLNALPPNVTFKDKHYLGFYDNHYKLIAIIDLITNYPNKDSVFIGLFMVDKNLQNQNIGSSIINDLSNYLKTRRYKNIRLGCVKNNEIAKSFWRKNNFKETGEISHRDLYDVFLMNKELN